VILFVLNIEKNNWQILTDKFSNGFTPENVLQGYVIDRDEDVEQQISGLVTKYNNLKDSKSLLNMSKKKDLNKIEQQMITLIGNLNQSQQSKEGDEDAENQQSDSEDIELIESKQELNNIPALKVLSTQFDKAEQKPEEEVSELKYLKNIDKHLKNIYELLKENNNRESEQRVMKGV